MVDDLYVHFVLSLSFSKRDPCIYLFVCPTYQEIFVISFFFLWVFNTFFVIFSFDGWPRTLENVV